MRSPQEIAAELAYLVGQLYEVDVSTPDTVPCKYKVEGDPESCLLILPRSSQMVQLWGKYKQVRAEFLEAKVRARAKALEATTSVTTTEETLQTLEATSPEGASDIATARVSQTKARKVRFKEPSDRRRRSNKSNKRRGGGPPSQISWVLVHCPRTLEV
ncbi:hypothetical protein SAPIO_CDS1709 [Scedosporium apiospermum]|uniref:Uncharacterized protein n=1 Tax=Pseudallescheria apiosperma TaxID=563466 RepID=A0A084GDK2_PSEDA|nr:uncharacterized protein SAPIO_CDS1709 [Scedosporium apiospermum]KEZ45414.1 hypothetical protein SAPIO_CDS1709 [Scedosporium apiospermum]